MSASKKTNRRGISLGSLFLAAAGGWAVYSHYGISHNLPVADAIPAGREQIYTRLTGRINFYADRSAKGRPLVLVHGVNAAASAYEVSPFFAHFRGQRPVLALDLPGFGFSERSDRVYTPELYEQAIKALLETQTSEPADVIALGLGSEFAARAALSRPDLIHSLTFISPTGLSRLSEETVGGLGPALAGLSPALTGLGNAAHMLLSFPLWARPVYDLLATRSGIELILSRSFVGSIPPGYVAYAYAAAHQPGAQYAPLYYLTGKLFTPQVRANVYERIQTPTLAIYDRDAFTNFSALPDLLVKNPAWQAVRLVPSLGLPHFERLADTVDVIEGFWKGV